MKIGVLSYCFPKESRNYGQFLQCFAMQVFLRKLGHDVYHIQYSPQEGIKTDVKRTPFRYLFHFPRYVILWQRKRKRAIFDAEDAKHDRKIDQFVKDELKLSSQQYDSRSIHETPPLADAFICGSDQIWGHDLTYYLDFVNDTTPKIAYAPSFGGMEEFNNEYAEKLKDLLKRFTFLGMREQSGINVCERLGIHNATLVSDPTLLLEIADYDKIRIDTGATNKYVFVYLLGHQMNFKVKDIFKFAKAKGFEIRYVANQGQFDKFPKYYPKIGEWIDSIANAEMVITNSFHATVFSLIYHKNFMTIPLSGMFSRMNTRVEDLLGQCNLLSRLSNKNIAELYNLKIDFTKFDSYHEGSRHKGVSLFKGLL